jgi:hypothetical protein
LSTLEYTKKRLDAFLAEIEQISASEFPYSQSRDALRLLKQKFESDKSSLNRLDSTSDPGVIKQKCKLISESMADNVLLLGFILRSTNVRNAFEVFKPTLRLAENVLQPHPTTQLILSSEWNYSPYVYFDIPSLHDFALIGLPAPESSNPFLIPLYGHELGHLVWIRHNMEQEMRPKLTENIVTIIQSKWDDYLKAFPHLAEITQKDEIKTNMFAVQSWGPAAVWSLKQAEESFSDFVGLYVFGSSFLHAFAYLISPSAFRVRRMDYPNTKTRVANLLRAAHSYKITIDPDYESLFENSSEPQSDKFLLPIADEAFWGVVDELIEKVKNIVDASSFNQSLKEEKEEDRIYERLKKVVPAEGCKTLPDILNAAWRAYNEPEFWREFPEIMQKKDDVLKELVLKNIEVYEIEHIKGNQA